MLGGRLVQGGAALLALAALALLLLGHGGRRVPARRANLAKPSSAYLGRGFARVSQTNASAAQLGVSSAHRLNGHATAHARYDGAGANGYARAIFNVDWRAGDAVAYSAYFYIPDTLIASMQGQVALMRWDDYPQHADHPVQCGIVIDGSDRRARLVTEEYRSTSQTVLGGPFDLPQDRWFRIEVRQRLGGDNALNEVLVDGRTVARSQTPNLPSGRSVSRVRYGLVAIAAGAQRLPLELWFDAISADPGATGYAGGPSR